ncbi:MAG: hypothetical protein NTY25_14455, partial [Planctomycetia bacterium]|nr:hypothetical protein [Planctomycetia bacterium]
HARDAETAAGSYDMREIHMAPQRSASHNQWPGRGQDFRRLVADVFEVRHVSLTVVPQENGDENIARRLSVWSSMRRMARVLAGAELGNRLQLCQ